jgi:hypothetical protein
MVRDIFLTRFICLGHFGDIDTGVWSDPSKQPDGVRSVADSVEVIFFGHRIKAARFWYFLESMKVLVYTAVKDCDLD